MTFIDIRTSSNFRYIFYIWARLSLAIESMDVDSFYNIQKLFFAIFKSFSNVSNNASCFLWFYYDLCTSYKIRVVRNPYTNIKSTKCSTPLLNAACGFNVFMYCSWPFFESVLFVYLFIFFVSLFRIIRRLRRTSARYVKWPKLSNHSLKW